MPLDHGIAQPIVVSMLASGNCLLGAPGLVGIALGQRLRRNGIPNVNCGRSTATEWRASSLNCRNLRAMRSQSPAACFSTGSGETKILEGPQLLGRNVSIQPERSHHCKTTLTAQPSLSVYAIS